MLYIWVANFLVSYLKLFHYFLHLNRNHMQLTLNIQHYNCKEHFSVNIYNCGLMFTIRFNVKYYIYFYLFYNMLIFLIILFFSSNCIKYNIFLVNVNVRIYNAVVFKINRNFRFGLSRNLTERFNKIFVYT